MAGFIEMPSKRASSSITKLSELGREVVEDNLADGKPYAEVIEALAAATGEKISRSALSRYRISDFEPTRRRVEAARQAATELAKLLADETTVETKFNATAQGLFDIMLSRVLEAKGADVTKLMREARMFQQVRNQVRKLENDEQRISMDREKLDLDRRELDKKLADFEAQQRKAKDIAGALVAGKQLSPEQVQTMRDFYGLDA